MERAAHGFGGAVAGVAGDVVDVVVGVLEESAGGFQAGPVDVLAGCGAGFGGERAGELAGRQAGAPRELVDGQVGARGATRPTSSTGITESLTKTNLVAVMPRCFFLFKTLFAFQ